jgi:hypothetical protein
MSTVRERRKARAFQALKQAIIGGRLNDFQLDTCSDLIVRAMEGADVDPARLAIFAAALPYHLERAGGLEPNEDKRRTRAIEDAIRTADEAIEKLSAPGTTPRGAQAEDKR